MIELDDELFWPQATKKVADNAATAPSLTIFESFISNNSFNKTYIFLHND